MVISVIHKIVVFIMYVLTDVIIDRCVHRDLDGNLYYVYVCQSILSVVKAQNRLNHSQVQKIVFKMFASYVVSSLGSSKRKWFHSYTRGVLKTTTTTTTTTMTTPTLPFGLPSIFTCAGRTNGYYADPVHCHKFHYCATGTEPICFVFFHG